MFRLVRVHMELYCTKSNTNFRDITRNVEENEILRVNEIFRVASRFPRFISRYIAENSRIYGTE